MVWPAAIAGAVASIGVTHNRGKQTERNTMPQYVRDDIKHYSDKVRQIGNRDPASRVPGASQLQGQAFNMAGMMGNRYAGAGNALMGGPPPMVNAGNGMMMPTSGGEMVRPMGGMTNPNDYHNQAAAIYGNIGQNGMKGQIEQFQSPYTNNVVNAAMNQFDHQTGKQQADMKRQQAASGFGGSGHAIQRAEFGANTVRNRASMEANLRDQAFMRAAGLAGQNTGFQLQGAAGLTGAGAAIGAQQHQDLNAMAALGGQQRAIQQEQANADINQLNAQLGLYNKVPTNYLLGKVTKNSGTSVQAKYGPK